MRQLIILAITSMIYFPLLLIIGNLGYEVFLALSILTALLLWRHL